MARFLRPTFDSAIRLAESRFSQGNFARAFLHISPNTTQLRKIAYLKFLFPNRAIKKGEGPHFATRPHPVWSVWLAQKCRNWRRVRPQRARPVWLHRFRDRRWEWWR